ncbi:MAG: cytochrome C assembly protein [Actinobacteria bacterium]|nr:MAG: cytochrome C assembly protein [Actinomycetota bacterium]
MNSSRINNILAIILIPLFLIAIYLVFYYAPVEQILGFSQKIFYFHVPLAWNGLLGFTIVFVASIAYLRTQKKIYDIVAHSAAEIGIIFTTLVLITGPIWAKPAWGTWWTWDVRLTTTLVLWLLYVGYFMLANSVEEEGKRGRFSAVYGVIAFIDVPLVFFSIRWWNSIHPVIFNTPSSGGMQLDPQMKVAFFFSLFVFTVLFAVLMTLRIKLGKAEEDLIQLKEGS